MPLASPGANERHRARRCSTSLADGREHARGVRHKTTFSPVFASWMSKTENRRTKATDTEQQALGVLHQDDCLPGLARLPDTSVDVVITDPPYEAECHTSRCLVGRAKGWIRAALHNVGLTVRPDGHSPIGEHCCATLSRPNPESKTGAPLAGHRSRTAENVSRARPTAPGARR